MAGTGKGAVFGIQTVTLAEPVAGGYPTKWSGAGTYSFKAIVRDSVSFNDAVPSENDLYVEEVDDIYATLNSDDGSKGFTLDTYDLSQETYTALLGYYTNASSTDGWIDEPTKIPALVKAVQIVTRDFGTDFPSKTFQWAKMKINVTRAGTIGKSGFPNFHLEFKQQANVGNDGNTVSGHRWKLTTNEVTSGGSATGGSATGG